MKFYQKLFAAKYDSFMKDMESDFFTVRKELISHLEGKILDVGSGTGVNFEHFNKNANVIAVEPSPFMMEKSLAKIPQESHIETHNLSVTDPKLEELIEENSLDYIVSTLVLCTIPDNELALKKFHKWLKPTGKLIILEHIHAEHKPKRILQNIINPVWKVIGDGCHLNRDTDVLIKEAGFVAESEEYFKRSLRFYQGVFSIKK